MDIHILGCIVCTPEVGVAQSEKEVNVNISKHDLHSHTGKWAQLFYSWANERVDSSEQAISSVQSYSVLTLSQACTQLCTRSLTLDTKEME